MNRELQNMSEESLQNLEAIVETELLTVEDLRQRLETTEKGKNRHTILNSNNPSRIASMRWSMILV